MVAAEAILTTRYGMKRKGQTSATFEASPLMLEKFNQSMYDHKRTGQEPLIPPNTQTQLGGREEEEEEEEAVVAAGAEEEAAVGTDMIQILNDVQELFGDPVFITYS